MSPTYVMVSVCALLLNVAVKRTCVPFATLVGEMENGMNTSPDAVPLVGNVIGGARKSESQVEAAS